MTKYREIIRLAELGLSQTNIALSCNASKTTVNKVLKAACNLRRTAATGAFASGHPAEPNGHLH